MDYSTTDISSSDFASCSSSSNVSACSMGFFVLPHHLTPDYFDDKFMTFFYIFYRMDVFTSEAQAMQNYAKFHLI